MAGGDKRTWKQIFFTEKFVSEEEGQEKSVLSF